MQLGTNRRRAAGRAALTAALLLTGLGLVPAGTAAAVAPTPIVIDDFSGSTTGRTVTTLPLPDTSTTSPGTFTESGGQGP